MKKLSALLVPAGAYIGLTQVAFAATDPIEVDPCPSSGTFASLCNITFGSLFPTLITAAFVIASLIALAFLIYGGIRWITSGGDKAGVESARNTIVAALVGLVITFLAYFIINIVFSFFGLDFATFTIPSIGANP